MRIELDNLNATVYDATDDELAWLYQYLSFTDEKSKFVRRKDGTVKYNRNQKRVSLLNLDNTFPAGLLSKVKRAAFKEKMLINVLDRRTPPCAVLSWAQTGHPNPWLYDFQLDAIETALQRTRGILDMPTGSGKTETAVGLAMRLGQTNTLFIAPEADLMHNAAKRWEKRAGLESGRVGDGWMKPLDGFTSATFQTLASRLSKNDPELLKYLQTVGCVIFDEVHTLPADMFYRTALEVPAYYRIGMSGTPLARGDRKSLFSIAATGSIIYKVNTQMLIDRGFISRPHIRMVKCEQEFQADKWQDGERDGIIESKKRNRLVCNLVGQAPSPCLVFVKLKKHGHALTKMLAANGLRVEFVWGDKNTTQRDEAIERLRDGQLDALVCSVVFQTGTDIPEVKSMVIACGGKSEIATLQRIGRGMRIVRDEVTGATIKDEFYVYDIMDVEPRGKPPGGNRWNAKHSVERFEAYTGVGHEVTIRETP